MIGGQYDDERAWQYLLRSMNLSPIAPKLWNLNGIDLVRSRYLESARPAYEACGAEPLALCFHNHATGHRPPASANDIAYEWLDVHFGAESGSSSSSRL